MGTLQVWHYPTKLFLKAADHTYVTCGNGAKRWGCWGGKTGGTLLRSGTGSTQRADAIAEANERAGITCYLVNGVCHQAANRILTAAGIIVSGARGYGLSEAMYGVYGHQLTWPCRGAWDKHLGVSGDLPECADGTPSGLPVGARAIDVRGQGPEADFVRETLALYESAPELPRTLMSAAPGTGAEFVAWRQETLAFHARLFDHSVRARLGPDLADDRVGALEELRAEIEREQLRIAGDFAGREDQQRELALAMNELTLRFQREAKNLVSAAEYEAIFDVAASEDEIVLTDPDVVATDERGGEGMTQ